MTLPEPAFSPGVVEDTTPREVFDGEGVHGPTELTHLPIRFLAVTAYPDNYSE